MVGEVPNIEDGKVFTIGETCKLLGIHRNTLRRYTKDGKIPYATRAVDGKTIYRGRAIKELILKTI